MAVAAPEAVASAAPRVDLAAALKGAAMTAVISFLLFLPLIGFKTVQSMRNELGLETRFPLLLPMVALITAAQLFGSLVVAPWRERRKARPTGEHMATLAAKISGYVTPFVLGFVLLYPVIVLILTGGTGALKWVDNFGIQI